MQVWEQSSGVIVMLTRNVEAGVLKCSEYLPASAGACQTYGESGVEAGRAQGAGTRGSVCAHLCCCRAWCLFTDKSLWR